MRLLVLGDGPELPRLEARAAALGVAGRTRFLGHGSRDDVIALFRAADAVLVTSAWENLPHTLLEALAAGAPVIATSVGGIPEVVEDGETASSCRRATSMPSSAAIHRILGDDELRASLAASAAASVEALAEPRILRRIVQTIVADQG